MTERHDGSIDRPREGARPLHGRATAHAAATCWSAIAKVGRRRGPGAGHRRLHRRRRVERRPPPASASRVAAPSAAARPRPRARRPRAAPTPVPSPRPSCSSTTGPSYIGENDDPDVREEVRRSRSRTTSSTTPTRPTRSSATTAAATTSRSRSRSTSRRSCAKGALLDARQVAPAEHRQPRHRVGGPGLRPGQRRTRSRTCGGRPASATTPSKITDDADQLEGALGRALRQAHRDARRLAGGVRAGADPARAIGQHRPTTAELDAALALLQQQKPLVRVVQHRHHRRR